MPREAAPPVRFLLRSLARFNAHSWTTNADPGDLAEDPELDAFIGQLSSGQDDHEVNEFLSELKAAPVTAASSATADLGDLDFLEDPDYLAKLGIDGAFSPVWRLFC